MKNLIDYEVNLNLKNVVRKILIIIFNKKITVLFSPDGLHMINIPTL